MRFKKILPFEPLAKLSFCRFWGSFELFFDRLKGDKIRKLILSPFKRSKNSQNNPQNRRSLSFATGSRGFFRCLALLLLLGSAGCAKPKNSLKIAATAIPHAQMLEHVKKELGEQGIYLDIIVVDDYNVPNLALSNGDIDANFFQHIPFLQEQIQHFHYPIKPLASIHIEPMVVYSKKIHSLKDLSQQAVITVPNDPTNEARALRLLQKQGLIEIEGEGENITVKNISSNPLNLRIKEIDAAMLPRTLEDAQASVIPTNFALQAGLSAKKEGLAIEDKENDPYINVIVIRDDEEDREELLLLKKSMTSESMRRFILETYQGAVVPVF
ncbi:MAG: MetQ/NlpA family ABC transporter substrate-binding protein [Anaerolineae bacterium]